MIKLTATHLDILSAATAREDGLAVKPVALKPAGAAKIAARLIELGLVRELRAKADMPVWREDENGKALTLKLLKAGRNAVVAMAPKADAPGSSVGVDDQASGAPGGTAEVVTPAMQPNATKPASKRALILAMLSRESGVTIPALMEATGWLPHTTRAALSVLRKGGLAVERSRSETGGDSIYRIDPVALGAAV